MTRNRTSYWKIALIGSLILVGSGASYLIFHKAPSTSACYHATATILPYVPERDQEQVVDLFHRDWYWLSVNEYSREHVLFMVNTGSPNEVESNYFGKMKVRILRERNGAFVGFVTYYMKNFHQGHILFLAIHPDYRGKRYADCLIRYALDDLKAEGAQEVLLLTYTPNTGAIKLYKRFGFVETHRDGKFVFFKYKL